MTADALWINIIQLALMFISSTVLECIFTYLIYYYPIQLINFYPVVNYEVVKTAEWVSPPTVLCAKVQVRYAYF